MRCAAAAAIFHRTICACTSAWARRRARTGSKSSGRRESTRCCAMFQPAAWWELKKRGPGQRRSDRSLCAAGACRDQTRAFGLRPLKNGVHVGLREPGIAVNQRVLNQRHLVILNLVGDFGEAPFAPHQRVLIPTGQVEMLAPSRDVVAEEPRDRPHVAVPGIASSLRMAVRAGPFQESEYA